MTQPPRLPPPAASVLAIDAPRCRDVYVRIVSAFDDPADSLATLAVGEGASGKARGVGDAIVGYQVVGMDYNWRRQSSAVWRERDGTICQALLSMDNPERRHEPTRGPKVRRRSR